MDSISKRWTVLPFSKSMSLTNGVTSSLGHIARLTVLLVATVAIVAIARVVIQIIYNVYFHPLSSYPGPKLWAATRLPWSYHRTRGTLWSSMEEFHAQYGTAVRIAPDEISYSTGAAWKTICGYGKNDMPKDQLFALQPPVTINARSLTTSRGSEHARQRKTVAHAFSDKALREQESWLQLYAGKLLRRFEIEHKKGPVDMVRYWNYITFDVIGELAFGESFGCLEEGRYDPYVFATLSAFHFITSMMVAKFYNVASLLLALMPKKLRGVRADMERKATEKTTLRLGKINAGRKDFFSYILKHNDKQTGMSFDELRTNAVLFIAAGSETTATALSGAVWYLTQHPEVYRKLADEVRSAFKSSTDILLHEVDQLPYLFGVIEETLRMYPPIPDNFMRVVPEAGETIDGGFVPGGTRVAVAISTANRSELNFHRAREFLPERWAKENRAEGSSSPFARDDHSAFQPFSTGPRGCIGRNLAYAEMKLFLSKFIFEYDFELAPESRDWMRGQKAFLIRAKPPLFCNLTPSAAAGKA